MKFLDKLNQIKDSAVNTLEKKAKNLSDIYKHEGVEGFLDRADKGLDQLEKKANQTLAETKEYVKDVHEKSKKEVEKENPTDKGVGVTVKTVSTIAKDVADKAKSLVESFEERKKTPSASDYVKYAQADQVELPEVMKFVGALKVSESEYVDGYKNKIGLHSKAWFDSTNKKGGVGAVSLLKYQLSLGYKAMDKTVEEKALEKESVSILDKMFLNKKAQEVKEQAEVEIKTAVPVKKAVAKRVVKKTIQVAKESDEEPKKTTRKSKKTL